MNKTKAVIIYDVPKEELDATMADLQRDGYTTISMPKPDGTYTVTGTKQVAPGESLSDNP